MSKAGALGFLAVAAPLILASFFSGHPLSELLFALLATAFPVALMALGAARRGRLGPTAAPLLVLLLLLLASVGGMLALRGRVADGPWLGPLPLAAALQLYGLWLLPLGLVGLAYALTFKGFGLRRRELEALRRRRTEAAADAGES